jgi:hypothetical protein
MVAGGSAGPGMQLYYIRVADDTTGHHASLHAAARLASMDGVIAASSVLYPASGFVNYLLPVDGEGWVTCGLHKDSTQVDQKNWQMQAANLPWAWGCATGDATTTVGVIDARMHLQSGATNVTALNGGDALSPSVTDEGTWHGDAVTEVMAAYGNDGVGMTGAMWRASVIQTDVQAYDTVTHKPKYRRAAGSPDSVLSIVHGVIGNAIALAPLNHERVVNISLGAPIDARHLTTASDSVAMSYANEIYGGLRRAAEIVAQFPGTQMPLVVVSAGNVWATPNGRDFRRSRLPRNSVSTSSWLPVARAIKRSPRMLVPGPSSR